MNYQKSIWYCVEGSNQHLKLIPMKINFMGEFWQTNFTIIL